MVKLERLRKGWNQTTLAFYTRISVADLSRIETGRLQPYRGQLDRIGTALDVAPSMLLDEVVVSEIEVARLIAVMRDRREQASEV